MWTSICSGLILFVLPENFKQQLPIPECTLQWHTCMLGHHVEQLHWEVSQFSWGQAHRTFLGSTRKWFMFCDRALGVYVPRLLVINHAFWDTTQLNLNMNLDLSVPGYGNPIYPDLCSNSNFHKQTFCFWFKSAQPFPDDFFKKLDF